MAGRTLVSGLPCRFFLQIHPHPTHPSPSRINGKSAVLSCFYAKRFTP
ncbi:hypothetical protein O59_000229 [Cellvibrio sp. BR]|nr:hypothetical protein O59_000229 [Cellvibrio sp. BR]